MSIGVSMAVAQVTPEPRRDTAAHETKGDDSSRGKASMPDHGHEGPEVRGGTSQEELLKIIEKQEKLIKALQARIAELEQSIATSKHDEQKP